MSAALVRYRVKPGRTRENTELVEAVYAELAAQRPAGFRYVTFLLDDGVTFMHLAITEGEGRPPLPGLASFKRFREQLPERCDELPSVTQLPTRIGTYGL